MSIKKLSCYKLRSMSLCRANVQRDMSKFQSFCFPIANNSIELHDLQKKKYHMDSLITATIRTRICSVAVKGKKSVLSFDINCWDF